MLSAGIAAERGLSVILLERNDRLGKKLLITGKGRCNITNNAAVPEHIEAIPRNNRFLYSALYGFTPQDTMAFFEGLGVPLKTERGGRVFPQSDRSQDVVSALAGYLKRTGVRVLNERAKSVVAEKGMVKGVKTAALDIECGAVILCTGGLSYPATGSTGDGYKIAESLGHTVIAPKPSLVPLETEDGFCEKMQGLSLRNVCMSVYNSRDKLIYEDFGELLFTHFGISGPLTLSASAHMRDFDTDKYYVKIDLKPALDEKKLDARILRDFEKYSNRDFGNALGDLANRLMIPVLIERSGIPPDLKTHSVTKEQRKRLLNLLKEFRIDIKAPRPLDEAIITSGGVNVTEINPSTMESKLAQGLYFAGEIIDADAYTGGFNLQIAWSTAHKAGTNVRQE